MSGAEVVQQLLVGRRLFQRVELLAVQVLDQRVAEQVIVLGLLDDGADLGQPGPLRGAPAALAHDQLVPASPDRTDDYRLQQADLLDRLGQLVERVLVEGPPRLARVRGDRGDRDLLVARSGDLAERRRGRFPGRRLGRRRAPRGLALSQPAGLRDQRSEPSA